MAQMRNQTEDGERSMGESYHVDLSQKTMVALSSEADDALLMELIEDLQPSDLMDGDMDRLSHVIQSLEAEIVAGEDVAARMVDGESVAAGAPAGAMDDMLLDLDQYEGGSFGYWPEMSLMGHEAEGWYVYSNGYEGVVGYEAIDHQYHFCVEGCVEQVYSPLWE
ncbi:unnamed protein product [Urochloa humidicola]